MEIMKHICSPKGLLIMSAIILLVGKFVFHKEYLNCFEIMTQHLKCFEKGNGKISKVAIFLYFVVPFFISLSLVQIRSIDDTVINILAIIISILTSMFFTLLTLILDMRKKIKQDKNYDAGDAQLSTKLLRETYYSIMFEILVSIVILIMCFIDLFAKQYSSFDSLVIYYLVFILLTNLFMILKRVYKVIDRDLNDNKF
ncbi:hypothetical protein [Hungatella effluvii]|uniref:hypothetical protein n=1 Tax=Hungatella effluvii TaxID=1096246 RepID=UPI002A814A32|nr:hypothetical protein [Hungatella effluvii]